MTTTRTRREQFSESPEAFRDALLIDADAGPKPFGSVMDEWQRQDFAALDGAWLRLAGKQTDSGLSRAYLERPRGHSKTSDLAVMTIWALLFANRPIRGLAAAADKDQARLLRDAVKRLAQINPWIGEIIEVQNYRVVNIQTEGELTIISNDVASSWGHLVDFVVCDELCHWEREELWHSLLSTAAKKAHTLLLVITNAGLGRGTHWTWNVREQARQDDGWYFASLDGPQASWITTDRLEEQQRFLPPSAYKRLWLNQWATGEGDAIPYNEIRRAVTLPSEMPQFMESYAPFVSALDMGARHDHAAHVVLGLDWRANRFRLAHVKSWNPRDFGGTIPFDLVRQGVLEDLDKFRVVYTVYDRWQAIDMAQQLRSGGHAMIDCPTDPKAQNAMAVRLLEVFHSDRIDLYDHEGLLRDLSRMSIVERIHGFKIEAPRDEHGHADRGMSLAMLLPFAQQWNRQLVYHHLNPEPEETIIVPY